MSTHTRKPPALHIGLVPHVVGLALLLGSLWLAWRFLGRPFPIAFWIAVATPVVHQVFVWLAWRLELRSKATSRAIGFQGYVVLFFLLFGGRFVALLVLAWLDRGSLGLASLPRAVLTALLFLPGAYTMYSVQRHFGMLRAAGADHFDPRYREMPLIEKGIFRITSNGMYLFGFSLFWAIAVGFDSSAALLVAAYSHLYIWLHFHTTEKPDMKFLYGP